MPNVTAGYRGFSDSIAFFGKFYIYIYHDMFETVHQNFTNCVLRLKFIDEK